jgi:hypothetical protein
MKSYNGFTPTQRMKALGWLKEEWAAGRRVKGTACDACGQTEGRIDAHSEDYSAPYGDHIGKYTFCYRCHMMIHCRFRNKDAWYQYRKDIKEGKMFEPIWNNFPLFCKQSLTQKGVGVPYKEATKKTTTVLDQIN